MGGRGPDSSKTKNSTAMYVCLLCLLLDLDLDLLIKGLSAVLAVVSLFISLLFIIIIIMVRSPPYLLHNYFFIFNFDFGHFNTSLTLRR